MSTDHPTTSRHAVSLVILALVLLACAGVKPSGPSEVKPRARDELKALVMGKSKEEVLKILGKPERTIEFESGDIWRYQYISHDPVADKTDLFTSIWFDRQNRVEKVNFH